MSNDWIRTKKFINAILKLACYVVKHLNMLAIRGCSACLSIIMCNLSVSMAEFFYASTRDRGFHV